MKDEITSLKEEIKNSASAAASEEVTTLEKEVETLKNNLKEKRTNEDKASKHLEE